MARRAVSAERWFQEASRGAPSALRDRAAALLANPPGPDPAEWLLAGALAALGRTLRQRGDRSVALDLLAADALVTLALAVVAEREPDRLAVFAARVRRAAAELR